MEPSARLKAVDREDEGRTTVLSRSVVNLLENFRVDGFRVGEWCLQRWLLECEVPQEPQPDEHDEDQHEPDGELRARAESAAAEQPRSDLLVQARHGKAFERGQGDAHRKHSNHSGTTLPSSSSAGPAAVLVAGAATAAAACFTSFWRAIQSRWHLSGSSWMSMVQSAGSWTATIRSRRVSIWKSTRMMSASAWLAATGSWDSSQSSTSMSSRASSEDFVVAASPSTTRIAVSRFAIALRLSWFPRTRAWIQATAFASALSAASAGTAGLPERGVGAWTCPCGFRWWCVNSTFAGRSGGEYLDADLEEQHDIWEGRRELRRDLVEGPGGANLTPPSHGQSVSHLMYIVHFCTVHTITRQYWSGHSTDRF